MNLLYINHYRRNIVFHLFHIIHVTCYNIRLYKTLSSPSTLHLTKKSTAGFYAQYYGKSFEEKTCNEKRLLEQGFSWVSGYIKKTTENNTIVFGSQQQIKKYIKIKYNIDLFRYPDEAYLFEPLSPTYESISSSVGEAESQLFLRRETLESKTKEFKEPRIKTLKILEKKEQKTNGSVETKLWASPSLKREYQLLLGNEFNIKYGLCVNHYLENLLSSNKPKYVLLKQILNESNIDILYGDNENYFTQLDNWITDETLSSHTSTT